MVPVGVGQKKFGVDRSVWKLVGNKIVAQFPDAGTCVNNDTTFDLLKVDFNTGGIAAILHGERPWTGYGSTNSPEFNSHFLVSLETCRKTFAFSISFSTVLFIEAIVCQPIPTILSVS